MAKGLGPIGWLGVIVQILQRNARLKGFNGAVKIARCLEQFAAKTQSGQL